MNVTQSGTTLHTLTGEPMTKKHKTVTRLLTIFAFVSIAATFSMGSAELNPCPADLNNDQTVDLQDFAAFAEHFGRADCSPQATCHGDFLTDGDSDGQDLAQFSKDFKLGDCPGLTTVTITSPVVGELIERPHLLVKGTFSNLNGEETGITVNGQPALVSGTQFAANHIPLHDGPNTITVVATTLNHPPVSASTTVTADTSGDFLRLQAHPEAGTAPFEVKLTLNPTLPFTNTGITGTDPPAAALIKNSNTEYLARIDSPGITVFTAAFIDFDLNLYTDEVAVVVLDAAELDSRLKAKWNGMKSALLVGDIEGALSFFQENSRNDYRELFSVLHPQLPDIASTMRDIDLITLDEKTAKYRINRWEEVQGQMVDISYFVYFIRDYRGLWLIDRY